MLFNRSKLPLSKAHQFIIFHCFFCIIISFLFNPDLASVADMVENFAWGQTFNFGTFKHPPLVAWETGFWFSFFPTNDLFYIIFSYVNVYITLIGILKLAKLFNLNEPERFFWVAGFSILNFCYSFLASKMNANTVLLPWWPWATYFFISSLNKQTYKSSILLGITSAFAIQGKYYSILLLLTFFIISISNKKNRKWYGTSSPYIVFLTFFLIVTPHIFWLFKSDFYTLKYASSTLYSNIAPIKYIHIILSFISLNFFAWLFIIFCCKKKLLTSLQIISSDDQNFNLLMLTIIPYLLTLACAFLLKIRVATPFTYPIWFTLPILFTKLIEPIIEIPKTSLFFKKYIVSYYVIIFLLGFLFLIYSNFIVKNHSDKHFLARKELSLAVERLWKKNFPNQSNLNWAAGNWETAATLAFYAKNHPYAYLEFPSKYKTINIAPINWKKSNGVLFCINQNECLAIEKWLISFNKPIIKTEVKYYSKDWRALHPPVRYITAYFYIA